MKVFRFIALFCLAVTASVAAAQDAAVRIGVVNIERLMRDAAPAKAAQQKLEAEFSKRDKELQDLAGRLKSMSERLERDASVLSEADRQRRQREVAELDRD
ncbi:MAG: OmpH family outer membrane protein, partial [Burkholderiaceae bacterium]